MVPEKGLGGSEFDPVVFVGSCWYRCFLGIPRLQRRLELEVLSFRENLYGDSSASEKTCMVILRLQRRPPGLPEIS